MTKPYPEVDFSEAERFRERELLEIGKAFAREMDRLGNTYALKGGTALRFLLNVPRPSMDLDFEGEQRIWVRRYAKRALRAAFPNTRYSVDYDLMRTGEIRIRPPKDHGSAGLELGVDYRDRGFGDVPTRIPLEKCTRYDGIVIYKPAELVHRKLETMVGANPRYKPRDIYDTGWIATTHPELIKEDDARKLKNWVGSRTPTQIQKLKKSLATDRVTGQIDANELWECVVRGIYELGTRTRIRQKVARKNPPGVLEQARGGASTDSKDDPGRHATHRGLAEHPVTIAPGGGTSAPAGAQRPARKSLPVATDRTPKRHTPGR